MKAVRPGRSSSNKARSGLSYCKLDLCCQALESFQSQYMQVRHMEAILATRGTKALRLAVSANCHFKMKMHMAGCKVGTKGLREDADQMPVNVAVANLVA